MTLRVEPENDCRGHIHERVDELIGIVNILKSQGGENGD
jgi:hypothetical protein